MGGGKVQGEAVVVKAGGGGEREWRQWWEGRLQTNGEL